MAFTPPEVQGTYALPLAADRPGRELSVSLTSFEADGTFAVMRATLPQRNN